MIGTPSTDATQSTELPGYEPPFKERRLSRKLILRQDTSPKQNPNWTPTLNKNVQSVYVNDDQDDRTYQENTSNGTDKSRVETSQYPIFTETILENTQFQNVLVDNINRILETSSERVDVSIESGSQDHFANNNSLQEQVKHAIDNIIMSTERDPTFQQVLDDVVQYTAINHEQTNRLPTLINAAYPSDSVQATQSPVPLKQRLRNRSQDKPRPNYNENESITKKKQRKGKVEVISNEIVSGEIRDLLHPQTSSSARPDSYVPLNQILYLNPDKGTANNGFQDLVYVNVAPCVNQLSQFRIDADTPMFLQDISLANNGATTSLTPGSIINLPTMDQQIQPIQSLLPNVVVKDIVEVNKTKPTERSSVKATTTTPTASKIATLTKSRNLTSPRRQSHVRSLNFTTNDDVAATSNVKLPSERKRTDNARAAKKSDVASTSKQSETKSNAELGKSNTKTSLEEEVDTQQDSSDAVDFSKEFDEATVISVELSPNESKQSKEEDGAADRSNGKKKPQTRRQCQEDLAKWKQMRQMKKGEWDNYLRQTVASKPGKQQSVQKRKLKRRKAKTSSPNADDANEAIDGNEANVSAENGANTTIDMEARLLEAALESAKKSDGPAATKGSLTTESAKERIDSEQPTATTTTTTSSSARKTDSRKSRSPNKRSKGANSQLIQIKLPASVKKKARPSSNNAFKCAPASNSPHKSAEGTSRIDPSQTIDIDLISPIEHPKPLTNAIKSAVNLNSFLETPCKETSSFKYPITPGFVASSSIKTPAVRLLKDCDSLIKFPEYPTPSFAITPGRTKTPMSQSSSQKDGSSYNRATDYSSGSSYYKPDESDDVDKNLEAYIKETRQHVMEFNLGVVPQENRNDEPLSDGEISESSSSSGSASSDTSSSSCSSSLDSTNDNGTVVEQPPKDPRTQQQLRLEQVRLRTMATLKTNNKIERFRKPKTKMSALQRHKAMEVKKPIQNMKMTGNSTPKGAPKAMPKQVNKPNPKVVTTTPSKRKIATPRRVIYLDIKDAIKTSVRVVSHDRKQAAQLPPQVSNNSAAAVTATKQAQDAKPPPRPFTPTTETIDAIENHIAKTSHNSAGEYAAKSNESQIDTPNLLKQLQDKNDATDALTPEMGPPTTARKRESLVRELFGEGAMSDSDFMDTPVKPAKEIRRTSSNEGPIAINRTSQSSTDDSKIPKADANLVKVSVATIPNANSNDSKSKDSKSDDSTATNSTLTDSTTKECNSINSVTKNDQESLSDHSTNKTESADGNNSKEMTGSDSNSPTKRTADHSKSMAFESYSECEGDDGDDYDDCTLVPSMPVSNNANRIYHSITSDTKERAIKSTTNQDPDLRPLTTYLDDKKIVVKTCDEVVLYSFSPKTESPPASGSKTVIKKRTNVKTVDGNRKVEDRYKKVQKLSYDGVEKNARFNIVAKRKGPIDASSR